MYIRYRLNAEKALNAILWLAQRQPLITFHTISKVLFYADKKHLLSYGRPVIGDEYTAMRWGPVPSDVYNLLQSDPIMLEALGLESVPFEVVGSHSVRLGECGPDMTVFSDSDIEALEQSFTENAHLSFGQLVDKTHREPEYKNAPGHWMRYEDYFEGDPHRDERVADLVETSRRMVI